MNRNYPFTSDDLRHIADVIDEVVKAVGADEPATDDWRWGLSVDIFDDDGETVLGQLRYHDAWLGYFPRALTTKEIEA